MDTYENVFKSKAKMIVRTVFRGKRKQYSKMNVKQSSSSTQLKRIRSKPDNYSNKLVRSTCSKEAGMNNKTKVKYLLKKYNNKRESISVDNILKGRKIESSKLSGIINENDKLKQLIQTQKTEIQDLKHQLTSVFDSKIEYLSTPSNHKLKSPRSTPVGIQTNSYELECFEAERYDDQPNIELEDLKQQLYLQTLVTRSISSKYLKLKAYKDELLEKITKTETFYKLFVTDIMQNFEECRISFALAQTDKMDKGSIEQILDKNARLAYNNAAMQLELFRLEKELKMVKKAQDTYVEDDIEIIKAVKAKSYEDSIARRPSNYGSNKSRNNIIRRYSTDGALSQCGETSLEHQISISGSVISVPVVVMNNGKVSYRMTPMFETVTDLQDAQQPISVKCDRNFSNVMEYKPELVSASHDMQ